MDVLAILWCIAGVMHHWHRHNILVRAKNLPGIFDLILTGKTGIGTQVFRLNLMARRAAHAIHRQCVRAHGFNRVAGSAIVDSLSAAHWRVAGGALVLYQSLQRRVFHDFAFNLGLP